MTAISEKYASKGLVVLAVNAWDEPKDEVARFVKENKLRHTILLNGESTRPLYEVKNIPTTFWIDASGIVQDAEVGFGGPEDLETRTMKLLNRGK